MAEELNIDPTATKVEKYQTLVPQLEALVSGEPNRIANMANISAALKQTFGFFWVGFYLVEGVTLVLGPFQGPIACTRIKRGTGVCGTAWIRKKTIIVPDVNEFPGHIACNSGSKSEIVVPGISKSNRVRFVLDVDSDRLNGFDEIDQLYLEKIIDLIAKRV